MEGVRDLVLHGESDQNKNSPHVTISGSNDTLFSIGYTTQEKMGYHMTSDQYSSIRGRRPKGKQNCSLAGCMHRAEYAIGCRQGFLGGSRLNDLDVWNLSQSVLPILAMSSSQILVSSSISSACDKMEDHVREIQN